MPDTTHADRLYWPDERVTKADLAEYGRAVWRWMEPHVIDRPLTVLRCPEGVTGDSFFQRHPWKGMRPHIHPAIDPATPDRPLIAIRDLDGLVDLIHSAALEIHVWNAPVADLEHPDRIVMDLDPGDDVGWTAICDAAIEIRDRLERAGLAAFVKTSGGRGLHVVTPLRPQADWTAVRAFAHALADAMAHDDPRRYVSTISKARRHGRILIDYLRNQRTATAVAPYSPRARPGAKVSMPLSWPDLAAGAAPGDFTIMNTPARLTRRASDPWAGFHAASRALPG
ncbi:DNA ligase [Gluconacetobacter johannae DSM 13595]|uniref:DNA polymerase domain-containing protein n=1 Tax=Gluconacetobacter johannae TaxID=112140 RepID=A0A7W4P3U1_9PROT|nr:non-homologous end-joining DNA ligase [Gluconacetobacter johannae]MBB2174388.1 DNA polymerase domain-containing protein [Gluconacetobacter johannae]GBQ85058.1 DNA ligase [Gluconacetobacter johannae DSM 13595]